MFYGRTQFIKAHQDVSNPYYNYSYDREVRDTFCTQCYDFIGKQVKYKFLGQDFAFEDDEKNNYTHCPYCGHKFKKGDVLNGNQRLL